MNCEFNDRNLKECSCTYEGCSRKGRCCECLRYHLKNRQLPACAFTKEAEATYDRSFGKFVEINGDVI